MPDGQGPTNLCEYIYLNGIWAKVTKTIIKIFINFLLTDDMCWALIEITTKTSNYISNYSKQNDYQRHSLGGD